MARTETQAKLRARALHDLQAQLRAQVAALAQGIVDLEDFPREQAKAMAAARFVVQAQAWALGVVQELAAVAAHRPEDAEDLTGQDEQRVVS